MNKPIRIGIIGTGRIAQWHTRAYRRCAGVTVTAMVGRDRAADLIADGQIHALDICSPTPTHKAYILSALEHGLHVYCEKPLCASRGEIQEIITAARTSDRVVFNGFNYRYLPWFAELRGHLQHRTIGPVRYLRFCRTSDAPSSSPSAEDPSIFHQFHSHFIDLLNYIGYGYPTTVNAFGTRCARQGASPDTATIILRYPDNILADITTSDAAPGGATDALIIGEQGRLTLRYGHLRATTCRPTRPPLTTLANVFRDACTPPFRMCRNPFLDACRHFVECVATNTPTVSGPTAAYNVALVCDAATQSFENEGESVKVEGYQ